MSSGWDSAALLAPIADGQPCGQNLEYTTLATLETGRLFGQRYSFQPQSATPDTTDRGKEPERARKLPEWDRIRETALEGVAQSKDLRLLAHLGAALLWTEGLAEFVDTLKTAAAWLEQYWSEVYPLLDGDGVERRNALNCLADPRVVLERLSNLPLADSPRHGKVSLATIKLAATPPRSAATSRPNRRRSYKRRGRGQYRRRSKKCRWSTWSDSKRRWRRVWRP